jgi:hypothetical protein
MLMSLNSTQLLYTTPSALGLNSFETLL